MGTGYEEELLTKASLRTLKAKGSPISNPSFQIDHEKTLFPFGNIPLLVEADLHLAQTTAIMQYIGMKNGLAPKEAKPAALCTMISAACGDFFELYWPEKIAQNKYLYPSFAVAPTPGNHREFTSSVPNYLPPAFGDFSASKGFRRVSLPTWLTYFEALRKRTMASISSVPT